MIGMGNPGLVIGDWQSSEASPAIKNQRQKPTHPKEATVMYQIFKGQKTNQVQWLQLKYKED